MGTGQDLYKKAKNIIPGGTMLLSKRPEMFLPEGWPSYFDRSKGCYVWDLDGNKYLDMHIMGIGTNILGYGHPIIDEAVSKTIRKGNMSTFNCPEEVALAEKLIEMHPWGDMVRFARSGGEANAIAIRIARAASGRDKIAICGYHGWHDWYLSANLANEKGLNGHLLPGLDPAGVPRNLEGTVIPFNYNDLDQITEIVRNNPDLGAIKMEVSRNMGPKEGYLNGIRKLCDNHNIILIFDECTSGFRETFGGLHKKYNVEPDICMFGKALGNGYAITAILGKRSVMEATQNTFISSTFWTERIGPTAALATLNVMEELKSWEIISSQGEKIKHGWLDIAKTEDIPINISGLNALASFSIQSEEWLKYKTYITQEMLNEDILAGNSVYVCIDHQDELIDTYLGKLQPIFKRINRFIKDEENIKDHLKYPICHSGFKRLN